MIRVRACLWVGLLCAFAWWGVTALPARAAGDDVGGVPAHAAITPATARLGQRLHYHGVVFVSPATRVRFVPPADEIGRAHV